MDYLTIDFEASCLPRHGRSYPIEVGIAGPAVVRSWLIRPPRAWREWDWTAEAFGLHGISREQLLDEGLEPEAVFAELDEAIGNARVIADSRLDAHWWKTLAGVGPTRPAREIEHVSDIFDELGATDDEIRFAKARADALYPVRHRAGPDAAWLRGLISALRQAIARRRQPAFGHSPAIAWPRALQARRSTNSRITTATPEESRHVAQTV